MGTPTKVYYEKLDEEMEHRRRLDRAKAKHFIQARFGRKLSQLGIPYLIDLTTGKISEIKSDFGIHRLTTVFTRRRVARKHSDWRVDLRRRRSRQGRSNMHGDT